MVKLYQDNGSSWEMILAVKIEMRYFCDFQTLCKAWYNLDVRAKWNENEAQKLDR